LASPLKQKALAIQPGPFLALISILKNHLEGRVYVILPYYL
jgi:hypothetical protein